MWQTLSSKEVFVHPKLTVIEDEVLLPSGVKTTYLKFKDTMNGVTVICKNEKGEILLEQEYAYPLNKVLWQFPGGGVPLEEAIEVGANRELMEEAKFYAHSLTLLGTCCVNNRRSGASMYVFLATNLEPRALPSDPEEEIKTFWLSEEKIDDLIQKGEFISSYGLAAWCLYKNRKRN
jgi:ADP-ribose pyrophosphatase